MSSRTHAFFVVVFLTHPPGLLLAAASPLQHRQNGQICCKDSVPASSKDCFKHFQGGTFRKCCRVSAIIVFSWPKATNPIKYWCVSLCDMRGHLVLWFGETPVFNSKLERQWALNSWSLGPIFVRYTSRIHADETKHLFFISGIAIEQKVVDLRLTEFQRDCFLNTCQLIRVDKLCQLQTSGRVNQGHDSKSWDMGKNLVTARYGTYGGKKEPSWNHVLEILKVQNMSLFAIQLPLKGQEVWLKGRGCLERSHIKFTPPACKDKRHTGGSKTQIEPLYGSNFCPCSLPHSYCSNSSSCERTLNA